MEHCCLFEQSALALCSEEDSSQFSALSPAMEVEVGRFKQWKLDLLPWAIKVRAKPPGSTLNTTELAGDCLPFSFQTGLNAMQILALA